MCDPANLDWKSALRMWLFNPFHYIAGGQALAAGLAIILLAGINGGVSHLHFYGVFDAYIGASVPSEFYVAEGLIDWFTLSLALWVAGLLVSRSRIRAIDIFGTQALARIPTLVIVNVILFPGFGRQMARLGAGDRSVVVTDMSVFALVALIVCLMLIWMVLLMYRAFTVSSNARGVKAVVGFFIGAVVAEVASKLLIAGLFQCC